MTNLLALPAGTELVGDFRIKKVLGAGGFGITYLADEIALARQVTIKEYFPADFAARDKGKDAKARSRECAADYKWGLERFIDEAKTLARFDHPNIVRVYRYFRANNTGYMVLHFEEGKSFKGWLKGLGRAPRQAELDDLLRPILDALESIHMRDFLHRDIAPDNIMVRKDKSPVLIDFGSARGEIVSHSRTVSALVKPGYSPYEQYASTTRQQGPWTDIYALGATFYQAVTGKRPPDAPSRMVTDEYIPARQAALGTYRPAFLAAIDRALRLEISERPQSIADWRKQLLEPEIVAESPPKARTARFKVAGFLKGTPSAEEQSPVAEVSVAAPAPSDVPAREGSLAELFPAPVAGSVAEQADAPGRFGLGYGPAPQVATGVVRDRPIAASVSTVRPASPALPPALEHAPDRRKSLPKTAPQLTLPPQAPVERRHPIKERRGWFFLRQPWRGLIVKFAVGIAVASLLVAYQNRLPVTETAGKVQASRLPRTPSNTETPTTGSVTQALASPATAGGHDGPLTALATGSGSRIVSVGQDRTLRVWNGADGSAVKTITMSDGAATSVAVDGDIALTAHADGTLALWDLEAGRRIGSYKSNGAAVTAAAIFDKGARFASAGSDGRLQLWERQALSGPVAVTEAHSGSVTALTRLEARDGLLSGGSDKALKLFSTNGLQPVRRYRGHSGSVTHIDSVAGGGLIASGDDDGMLRFWSVASQRLIRKLSAHDGAMTSLRLSPRADILATAGTDGTMKIWDVRRGKLLASAKTPGGQIRGLAFVDAGKRLLTGSEDGRLRVWDVQKIEIARD